MKQEILDGLVHIDSSFDKLDIKDLPETYIAYIFTNLYLSENKDIILDLIKEGANVNARNPSYETLLDVAINEGDLDFTKILVESGANPFQINSRGLNKLNRLFLRLGTVKKEMFHYILSLGLNPYNISDIVHLSRLTEEGEVVYISDLKEWSSFSEADNDYRYSILNGDLNGALSILQRTLNNLGPIFEDVDLSDYLQGLLIDYRSVLYLTGNKEQSKIVSDFLKEKYASLPNSKNIRLNMTIFALFLEDKDTFNKFNRNLRNLKGNTLTVSSTYVMEYLFIMRTGNQDSKKKSLLKRLQNKHELYMSNYHVAEIIKLFIHRGDDEKKNVETLFSEVMLDSFTRIKLINIYMIYLIDQKDYTNAKYISMKMHDLNREYMKLNDYYFHLLLLQYIEELEAPTN